MSKLSIVITEAGLNALIDAEAGHTNNVRIAEVALTDAPFLASPTLTELPGEFKRLAGVSGEAVSENVIHMVAQDSSEESYDVTGFGLMLENGVLFGVYSQGVSEGALFEKAPSATFLFAVDVTFQAGQAAFIDFGDANFINPPASETVKGVAYLATAAEVAAGVDAEKIVTPATLAGAFIPEAEKGAVEGVAPLGLDGKIPPSYLPAVDSIDTYYAASDAEMTALAAAGPGDFCQRTDLSKTYRLAAAPPSTLANWVEFLSPGAPVRSVNSKIGDVVLTPADVGAAPAARSITGTGLATGGGNLSADRAINVAIADAAETLAGLINDKAVTPASLASVLTSLLGKVPSTRAINTSGLATGGGDLSQNRTIDVPKATAADVEGGTNDTKAVTTAALWGTLRSISPNGGIRIPGTPIILQWGTASHTSSHGIKAVTWPFAFPSACWHVFTTLYSDPEGGSGDESDEVLVPQSLSRTGFNCFITGDSKNFIFGFLALGI